MISVIDSIKNNQVHIPIWFGQLLSYIPYSLRPIVGKRYRMANNEIKEYDRMTEIERKEFIFNKTLSIVDFAFNNIRFYQKYYGDYGFSPQQLKTFDDLKKIPLINKDTLLAYSLEDRICQKEQYYIVNTGGSSGKTLTFCSQRSQMAIESAHCHRMYASIGYKPNDLKMSIVGRKVQTGVWEYDFARHILFLNMYIPFRQSTPSLKKIITKYHLRYIQGYPSIVSEFASFCAEDNDLLCIIRQKLRGVILNSEYPYEKYVNPIEKVFEVPCLSFYGHTERCVLAQGDLLLKSKYYPFQTYGFTEAVADPNGEYHLVGTCYYNRASPLIRYDTEDIISSPVYNDGGILSSFEILEGRSGQFIVDRAGEKVSLTGLIMGRHHPIFNFCKHLQVYQPEQGRAILFYVPKDPSQDVDAATLVDLSGINMFFEFKKLNEPIRTASGKVNLLINSL